MQIPPPFKISEEMLALISQIEAQRLYLSSLDLQDIVKENIQRTGLLKSSLFSARIEGNPLRMSDFDFERGNGDPKKQEVFNILSAINFVDRNESKIVSLETLLKLHSLVLRDIDQNAGRLRTEISAIFNQAGVAVYMPPPPAEIVRLLNDLISYLNVKNEFPLLVAFVSHLIFEKIHPFLDGNGRVGRLLISAVLKAKGWNFTFAVPFEEYLDSHKEEYYFYLESGLQNTEDYLVFMLKAFYAQIQKIKEQIQEETVRKTHPFLPPRQEEIFNIIKDHVVVSFDMIHRRFLQVPPRTLRYDLKKLFDCKLIEKSGETKGSYYRVKKQLL